jgi:hypothetical protein
MARKKTDEEKLHGVLLSNVRELLKHRGGKDFIWFVLSRCNIYTPSFTGTADGTAFMEGKRSVGLDLLQLIEEADPSAYPRLLLEQQGIEHGRRNDDDSDDSGSGTGDDGSFFTEE